MIKKISTHRSGIFCLCALVFGFCTAAYAAIELPGYQSLGDNSNWAVSYDQLREHPFYVLLTEDVVVEGISLEAVNGLEADSSLVFFLDGQKIATAGAGATSVTFAEALALDSGLHTLALRGSCYDGGSLAPCSGNAAYLAIPDLSPSFVDPVGTLVDGDLNTPVNGSQQADGIQITGSVNQEINLFNGDDRLLVEGNLNAGNVDLGNGADHLLVRGNVSVAVTLGQGANWFQIDGTSNGEITAGNQGDIVKIKGNVNSNIDLSGGDDQLEILGAFNSGTLELGGGSDHLLIHGDVSGSVNLSNGADIVQVDGNINGSINGGSGTDTLYVNMTEAQWAVSWQKDKVSSFEIINCTDTAVGDLDEDDFTFSQIVLETTDSSQTTNAIHFIQKYHLGDDTDTNSSGSGWGNGFGWGSNSGYDGYDPADDDTPYYPDIPDGTEVSFSFNLGTNTTSLDIDFYRLRALDYSNKVYVDGVEIGVLKSGQDSVDLAADPYNLSVSGNWSIGQHQLRIVSTSEGPWFSQEYDDFSWDEIIIIPEANPLIDHYRIEHPATGITCQAATITVRACSNEGCTLEYSEETSVTMTAISNSSDAAIWVGGDTRTFTGHTEVSLQQTTSAIETIELTNPLPVAINSTRYYEDGVEGDNTVQFYLAGIYIDGDGSDTDNESDIVTQIAGKSSSIAPDSKTMWVKVLRTDNSTGACVPALLDNPEAQFSYLVPEAGNGLDNNAITLQSAADSAALNAAVAPANLGLSFNADGAASFELTSADAGKYQLKVDMDILVTDADGNPITDANGVATGETIAVSDISNAFVVRPFAVFADAVGNPKAQNAGGDAYKKAGEDFTLTFKSLAWTAERDSDNDGLWDDAPDSSLTDPGSSYARVPAWNIGNPLATVVAPSGGAGSLTYSDDVVFNAKESAKSVTASFDEVGIIQLAADETFIGETVKLYSPYIGRFYPHHFELSQGALVPRVVLGCSPNSSFTYLDENLEFSYTLTAQNSAGATTVNYADTPESFAKFAGTGATIAPTGGAYTIGANNDPDGTVTELSSRLDVVTSNKSSGWSSGVAEFTAELNVDRLATPDGPFSDTRFGVYVQDDDGVEIAAPDLDMDGDAVMDHTQAASAAELRYGRVRIDNAYGSEMLDLPMLLQAEYWNGVGFIRNSSDSCSTFTEALLTLSNSVLEVVAGTQPVHVGTGTTIATIANQPFMSGDGALKYSAPGAGGDGWIDVELTVPPYLQFDWQGSGDANPTARATFGIYKGSESIIYLRETTWR